MALKRLVFPIAVIALLFSCSDDDDLDIISVPPRELAEVEAENDADIREYLQTHFYNYEEFANPPADFDFRIVFDTIAGTNSDKTPLIQQVESAEIDVSTDEFGLSEEAVVTHTYYYLVVREGRDEKPTVADSVLVRYKGSLLDGFDFDGSFVNPVWFDLAQIQGPGQGARGFSEAMVHFEIGGDVIEIGDGTVTVEDYGLGAFFIPSGLGFFNVAQPEIPAYSPLVFTVDLFDLVRTDHDGDGILSILEDLNRDGYLYNDNTDEQQEEDSGIRVRFADFLDLDDDGDGTPTREEIIIDDEGNVSFPDSNGNGIPDYRDPDTP